MTTRRLFMRKAGLVLAAPAIVRIASIMPVSPLYEWTELSMGFTITEHPLPRALWPGTWRRWWVMEYQKDCEFMDILMDDLNPDAIETVEIELKPRVGKLIVPVA